MKKQGKATIPRCVLGVLFALVLFWSVPVYSADVVPGPPPPPPVEYHRIIQMQILDVNGAPLPGVELKLKPRWGRLLEGDLVSDETGLIRFTMQPAIEDVHENKKVTDRLLLYITDFDYELIKAGYMVKAGRFRNETDFASFSHPLYKGMSRNPDPEAVERKYTLYRPEDFLAGGEGGAGLKTVVESVYSDDQAYAIVPGSIAVDADGILRAALEFKPLFNPAEYGLQGAGAVLLREPVRHFLTKVWMYYVGFGNLAGIEITVQASFQYPESPFALPIKQTFRYNLSTASAGRLIDWPGDTSFPLDGIHVTAEMETLDLTPELDPDKILQAPGSLLTN